MKSDHDLFTPGQAIAASGCTREELHEAKHVDVTEYVAFDEIMSSAARLCIVRNIALRIVAAIQSHMNFRSTALAVDAGLRKQCGKLFEAKIKGNAKAFGAGSEASIATAKQNRSGCAGITSASVLIHAFTAPA